MKPILEIQHISKKYKLRGQETPYLTLRDALLGKHKPQETKEFWALNDVSFNVYPGESIGIIGRNGAGKSTLLKILSRITPPTKGKIISRGRIASLLEVGTGFHAELTGRENIFLNGSILGLRKQEIKAKFDEIVDFAGVEKFIDTPLKHYSSGMQLRLAFAVAAHLEPEILIIDEVLAVGDVEFQKKSLGKMEEVTKQGRTVLFVSHNMGAVGRLCDKGILLDEGNLIINNNIDVVVNEYYNLNRTVNIKLEDDIVSLKEICLINYNGEEIESSVNIEDKLGVKIIYEIKKSGFAPKISIYLNDGNNGDVILCSIENTVNTFKKGIYTKILWFPENFFNNKTYSIGIGMSTFSPHKVHFYNFDILRFNVVDSLSSITRQGYGDEIKGIIRPLLKWENI